MRRAVFTMVAILTAAPAAAQTAVLECVADTVVNGIDRGKMLEVHSSSRALLDFRFSAIEGWQIREARLMLHLAEGTAPVKIEVAVILGDWSESGQRSRPRLGPRRALPVSKHEQGWISVTVPPLLVEPSIKRLAHGIAVWLPSGTIRLHARESLSWAPYLMASGQPAVQRAKAGTLRATRVSTVTTDRPVW